MFHPVLSPIDITPVRMSQRKPLKISRRLCTRSEASSGKTRKATVKILAQTTAVQTLGVLVNSNLVAVLIALVSYFLQASL